MAWINGQNKKSSLQWVGIIMFVLSLIVVFGSLVTQGMGWDISFLNEWIFITLLIISIVMSLFANLMLLRIVCILYTLVLVMVAGGYSPIISSAMSNMITTLSTNTLTIYFIGILLGVLFYLVGRSGMAAGSIREKERRSFGGTKDW